MTKIELQDIRRHLKGALNKVEMALLKINLDDALKNKKLDKDIK